MEPNRSLISVSELCLHKWVPELNWTSLLRLGGVGAYIWYLTPATLGAKKAELLRVR